MQIFEYEQKRSRRCEPMDGVTQRIVNASALLIRRTVAGNHRGNVRIANLGNQLRQNRSAARVGRSSQKQRQRRSQRLSDGLIRHEFRHGGRSGEHPAAFRLHLSRELRDQARLPDAGLTTKQNQCAGTSGGARPHRLEFFKLALASDEREGRAYARRNARRGCMGSVEAAWNRFVAKNRLPQRDRLRHRSNVEFVAQPFRKAFVFGQRPGGVARLVTEGNEVAQGVFAPRIGQEDALRIADGLLELAAGPVFVERVLQERKIPRAQRLALGEHPVVVDIGKQIAGV